MSLRRLMLLAAVLLPGLAPAADIDGLTELVGAMSYPQIDLTARVSLSLRDVALLHAGDPARLLGDADARLVAAPDDPHAHLWRAMALEGLGRESYDVEYAKAAELFRAEVHADPDNTTARLGLAQALWEGGKEDEALPIVDELVDAAPDLWWPRLAQARDAAKPLWELVDLLARMRGMEFGSTDEFSAWFETAKTPAISGLASAIDAGRRDPEALGDLIQQLAGNSLMLTQEASEVSGGALSPGLFAVLVRVQASLAGTMAGGETSTSGGFAAVADELARLADEHRADVKVQVFARWASIDRALARAGTANPMNAWPALLDLDRRELTMGEFGAVSLLKQDGGDDSDVYELLSVYALLHGNLGGALDRLRESTQVDPTSAERWEAYIGTLTRTGDIDAIGEAAREGLQHSDSSTLRCVAAKVYQKQNDLVASERELLAAIGHDDDRKPLAQLMLGVTKLKQGNLDAALDRLRPAADGWTTDAQAETALAIAWALSGDQAEASAHIDRALTLNPDDEVAAEVRSLIDG